MTLRLQPTASPGLEFLVLTGFLGSGKTTLLRRFLTSEEAADTAVIVNEIGEIGLDGALLREVGGSVSTTMLANGCVCCQVGNDLAVTAESLLIMERPNGVPLARIVLETSGLSRPGPILRQLASLAKYRLRISVVTTYDPVRSREISGFEEAAAQWAGAYRIVVTKADLVSPERFAAAAREAAAINPLAEIVSESDRDAAVAKTFARSAPRMTLPSGFHAAEAKPDVRVSLSCCASRKRYPMTISRHGSTISPGGWGIGCFA